MLSHFQQAFLAAVFSVRTPLTVPALSVKRREKGIIRCRAQDVRNGLEEAMTSGEGSLQCNAM